MPRGDITDPLVRAELAKAFKKEWSNFASPLEALAIVALDEDEQGSQESPDGEPTREYG